MAGHRWLVAGTWRMPRLLAIAFTLLVLVPATSLGLLAQGDPRNAPIGTTAAETPVSSDPRNAPIPGDATPPGSDPSQAGDEGWIAYTGSDGNVWLTRPDGSEQRFATTDGSPDRPYTDLAWSPDGTMLVATRATGPELGEIGIFLIRDGTVEQVPNVTNCQSAAFSAGATRLMLLCAEARGDDVTQGMLDSTPSLGFVSSVNLDGTDWRVEVPFNVEDEGERLNWSMLTTHEISVSPVDGVVLANTIFWSSARSRQIYLFDGGEPSGFAAPAPDYGRIWGTFARDGENILARICRGCYNGTTEAANSSIELLDRSGNVIQTLYRPDPAAVIGSFDQSPDGSRLILSTTMEETDLDFGTPGLNYVTQLVDLASGAVTELPIEGGGFAWQPTSASVPAVAETTPAEPAGDGYDLQIPIIAYTCDALPTAWLDAASSGGTYESPPDCAPAGEVAFSVTGPDGEFLGACQTPPDNPICGVPAPSGVELTVTADVATMPDGYIAYQNPVTWTMPEFATGGRGAAFVFLPEGSGTAQDRQSGLQFAPQTNLIAYIGTDGNVWVMDSTGDNPFPVTTNAIPDSPYGAPVWSHDGTMLAFAGPEAPGVDTTTRIYLLQDGVLAKVPDIRGCGVVAFMPDDRQLALGCGFDADASDYSQAQLDTDPSAGFVSVANLDGTDWKVRVPFQSYPDGQWPVASRTWSSTISAAPDGSLLVGWYTPNGTSLAVVLPGGTEASRIDSPLGSGTLEGFLTGDGSAIVALICPGCYKHTREDPNMVIALLDPQGEITETLYTPDPLARLGLPSLSSDGNGLLYTLQGEGYPFYGEITLHDLASENEITLAEGMSPVWQPGATVDASVIEDMPIDQDTAGASPLELEPGSDLIAYIGTDGNVWLMDSDGSNPVQVTTDGVYDTGLPTYQAPAWSHDGSMLAFSSFLTDSEDDGIWLLTGGELRLLPGTDGCRYPAFSADNLRLLFACDPGPGDDGAVPPGFGTDPKIAFVSSANLDGGDVRIEVPYTTDGSGIEWGPGKSRHNATDIDVNPADGSFVVRFGGFHLAGLHRFAADGSLVGSFGMPGELGFGMGPYAARFMPDGERLVVSHCSSGCRPDAGNLPVYDIAVVDLNGNLIEPWTMSFPGQYNHGVDVSSDGQHVIASYSNSTDETPVLVRMDTPLDWNPIGTGSQPVWQPGAGVADASTSPTPASSGSAIPSSGQLAFAAKHGEHWDLYLHDFATTMTTQLTFEEGSDQWAPAWSHDGSQLAYLSDSTGSNQVWVMDPDGANQRQLTWWEGDAINAVAWSGDDQTLLVTLQGAEAKSFVTMPASGGAFTELMPPPSAHPSVANDGSMVYVIDVEGQPQLYWGLDWMGPPDGPELPFAAGAAPSLDPSGGIVVYQRGEQGARTIHGERRDDANVLDLPGTGFDDSNPVITADAAFVLWVTSDGTSYWISSARTDGNDGQYAAIDVGQHDRLWYLAWRP